MDLFSVITLFGGLALFLYGMSVMSNGLEKLAGGKMEQILRSLTSNKLKGMALGLGVTAVIQSSSAVTVMLVGLVNSGIMQLSQAINVTFGSNIGTTVTAWLLSLAGIDGKSIFIQILKPANFSPIIALAGIILIMACKSKRKKDVGSIMLGFAILMYGMTIMSDAVSPLADVPQFRNILTAFSNPVLGVVVGMLFTAIIQSSSASVGVLQAISLTGSLTYGAAIPIIMGQNIGTCISALLASIGTNKNAKRVALVHVLFNISGTVILLVLWSAADAIFKFGFTDSAVSPFTIAVIHSIFNVITTILLLPFSKLLEKASRLIIKDREENKSNGIVLDERLFTMPAFAVAKAMSATLKMAELSKKAVVNAVGLLDEYNEKTAADIREMEEQIDRYEDVIGSYLVKLSNCEMNEADSEKLSMLLRTISDFERIGDHATNLLEAAKEMHEKGIAFSNDAKRELYVLTDAVLEILSVTISAFETGDPSVASKVEPLEEVIDGLAEQIKGRHVARLKNGSCTIELGFILTDLLINFERISDHCSNVGVAIIELPLGSFESHEYLHNYKAEKDGAFADYFKLYNDQYSLKSDKI